MTKRKNYQYTNNVLEKKTASNKASLKKNKGIDDYLNFGLSLAYRRIDDDPTRYLEFGPYWWALKKLLVANGFLIEGDMDDYIAEIYKGRTDEETLTAAFKFAEFFCGHFFPNNRDYMLDDDTLAEYRLIDSDMECRERRLKF